MKKLLKIGMYLFSISSLAVVVFFGNLISRVMPQGDSSVAKTGSRSLLPLLGWGVNHAHADVPASGGVPGGDCGPGDSGSGDSDSDDC